MRDQQLPFRSSPRGLPGTTLYQLGAVRRECISADAPGFHPVCVRTEIVREAVCLIRRCRMERFLQFVEAVQFVEPNLSGMAAERGESSVHPAQPRHAGRHRPCRGWGLLRGKMNSNT